MPSTRSRVVRTVLAGLLRLPEPLHRLVRGARHVNDRGEVLDRDLTLVCNLERFQAQELRDRTVDKARRAFVDSCSVVEGPLEQVRTEDAVIPAPTGPIRVRWYVPDGAPDRALVYLHGGGWVVGDLETHDAACRWLAAAGQQVVVAVHYALAPEARFPLAHDEALAAFLALRDALPARGVPPERVGIGGDSAGGNLSAAVCLALRARGLPQPDVQLLVYPATDFRKNTASHLRFATGYLLTSSSIDWYLAHYGADPLDPRASVLLAPSLEGLAPAVVVTAGFDPLRDEGDAYAQRLAASGVPVTHLREGSQVHGFFSMRALPGCRAASDRVLRALNERRA